MQYLYDVGDSAVFMDTGDYQQLEIPSGVAGDAMQWVLPEQRGGGPVRRRAPTVCRSRALSRWRSRRPTRASRETPLPVAAPSRRRWSPGVQVEVPLFVNEGDRVRVDTRSGEYVSRA